MRRLLGTLFALAALAAVAPATASAALSAETDSGTKTVTITGDAAADTLVLTENASDLVHNIAPGGALESSTDFDTDAGVQTVAADGTWQIVVNPAGGDDSITIVTANVLRVLADLGDGDDLFQGSTTIPGKTADEVSGGPGDDRIAAGRGNDKMLGGEGNDVLVWNNGDNNDEIDGQGGGFDTTEVNGAATAGDIFTIAASGGDVRFDRTNLVPFFLVIEATTERLEVNGLGGNDTMSGAAGIAALGVSLALNGGNGDDTITGGDGADAISGGEDVDTLSGAAGADRIVGNRGNDTMNGGDGDDTLVWNNGDNSDVADGDGGFDILEVNGAGAGDIFTVGASGGRTQFARTNLVPFTIDAATEMLDLNGLGGDDTMTVTGAPLLIDADGGGGADTITGGDGHDALRGGPGNDAITGGGGVDAIDGDDGDDTVSARDAQSDLVRCGAGTDSATLDAAAVDPAVDCETAARPAPPVEPVVPKAAAVVIGTGKATTRRGRASISLQCPAGATTCSGVLTLTTLRTVRIGRARIVVVLGSARYSIAPGQRKTVRVKLTRSIKQVAGRSKRLKVRAVAATAAGERTAIVSTRTITLRRKARW